MTIFEQIQKYALTHLTQVGLAASYTPQGVATRTIYVIVYPTSDSEFYTGAEVYDYDVREMEIYSKDDTSGVIAPKCTGRDGAGDKVVLPDNSSVSYYVKKILVDGRNSSTCLHRVLIANTVGALLDG